MSCSPFDLRDYALGELAPPESAAVEAHARSCGACGEEIDRLRLTRAALLALPEEEIPQRIAFVSDKVFAPSPLRRWLAGFWGSAARLAFASSALLLLAAVVWTRPPAAPAPDLAAAEARFDARLRQEVAAAVTASETRQQRKTDELLAAVERRHELDRRALMLAVDENFDVLRKRLGRMYVTASSLGAPE